MARRCRLHARVVIGALNAFFVVAVAAVALSVTAAVALNQVRDNGEQHVRSLGDAAAFRVDQYFLGHEAPVKGSAEFARTQEYFPLPAEHPTRTMNATELAALDLPVGGAHSHALDKLWWGLYTDARYLPMSLVISLVDGSGVANVPLAKYPPLTLLDQYVLTDMTNPRPYTPPFITRKTRAFDPTTQQMVPTGSRPEIDSYIANRAVTFQLMDFRYPPLQAVLKSQANMTLGAQPVWTDFRYFFHGRDFSYIFAIAPLRNRTGFLLGFTLSLAELGGIRAGLEAVRPTPGTDIFALDKDDFILSSTVAAPLFNKTALNPAIENGSVPVPPGCASTHETRFTLPSDKKLLLCIDNARDAPHRVLQHLAASGSLVHGTLRRVSVGGSRYFVRVERLRESQLKARVVVIVPEEDVLGDVARTVLIAAVSTAAVVIVAAALSVAVVWAMLLPLVGIAGRMAKAARFEPDPEPVSESWLVEVGDLQRAFVEMRDELSRIRAFVPRHLLFVTDDDDEYDIEPSAKGTPNEGTPRGGVTLSPQGSASLSVSQRSTSQRNQVASSNNVSGQYTASADRHGHAAGHAGVLARIGNAIRSENVSVLVINARRFHRSVRAHGIVPAQIAAMVDAVLAAVEGEKGVVDSFHGDRFQISFNAARPAASHGIRAVVAAARVTASLSALGGHGLNLGVTCGVASGTAQVGNLGSASLKSFSVVGPVVPQAAALERLCKLYDGTQCLVPQALFADLQTAAQLRTVDYVRLPFAKAACLVADVVRELQQGDGDDEWMYQLQGECVGGDAKAPLPMLNAAWRAVAKADAAAAVEALAGLDGTVESGEGFVGPGVDRLRAAVAQLNQSPGSLPTPAVLGIFYDDALSGARE